MADNALAPRLKALTAFRAVFISLLLGSAYLFKIQYFYEHPRAISYYIIALYTLTIIYSLLLYRVKNFFVFTYVQLILDVAAEIALIYITGGVESWLSFTLILTVLSSSIILNKKAGYVIAGLSGLSYGVLLDLQFNAIVLPPLYDYDMPSKLYLYKVFIHFVSLYITAYLGGYLSSRLEMTVETLKEKNIHLADLELFNVKVIESMPSGLFTTDMNGNVLIFNRAAEKITGIGRELVIGSGIGSALPFLKEGIREGRHEELLDAGTPWEKDLVIHISPLFDASGKETGLIGVFQDMTHLKKLEAEIKYKEKWAAIGELSANIAHEIRNPLASMKSSIEMLHENRVPVRHRDRLMEIALEEMGRLNNIVTDFLTYSSPKPLELMRVDIHLLLEETLALIINIEQDTGRIRIQKNFEGSLFIDADPRKIRQVFWNLGMNAVEAMPEGGELSVSTRRGNGDVMIVFSDTGIGINPTDAEKIFYPFFTTKNNGTGLGLAIAYRIIEEHGGRLSVKSIPGIKTSFEIILNGGDGKH